MKLSRQKISRLLNGSIQSNKRHRKRAKPVRERRHGSKRLRTRINLRQRTMKRRVRGGAPLEVDKLATGLQDVANKTIKNETLEAGVRQVAEVLKLLIKSIESSDREILKTPQVRDAWNQFSLSIDSFRGNYYSQRLAKAANTSSSKDECKAKSTCALIAELNVTFDEIRKDLLKIKLNPSLNPETRLVVAQWIQRVYDLVRSSTAQNDFKMYDARLMLVADASANASMYTKNIIDDKLAQSMAASDKTLYKLNNKSSDYKKAHEDWVTNAMAIGNKIFVKASSLDAKTTVSIREFLLTKLNWPANTVATLMENLSTAADKSINQNEFVDAMVRTARVTFLQGVDTGRVPPTIGEVNVQAGVRAGITNLPSDESQEPVAPVRSLNQTQSGGSIRSLGIPDNIGESENIDCINKGDKWARNLIAAGALQLSGTGNALPLSQLRNQGVGILVGLDQVREAKSNTIVQDVKGLKLARGDGVSIYNVYGDGLCGWYSWIMGAQNSLALMTDGAQDYVTNAFVRGLWIAINQMPSEEATNIKNIISKRRDNTNLNDSVWNNLQKLITGSFTLENLDKILIEKQKLMLSAIDAAFIGFNGESTPHLRSAWELIVGYPMIVTILLGNNKTVESIVSYPRDCVDAIRNNVLFHYFKTPAITFKKQEIREKYAIKHKSSLSSESYAQVAMLDDKLAKVKAKLSITQPETPEAEEIESEAAIIESTLIEMRQNIKKYTDSRALVEALPLRARLAAAYAETDPDWSSHAEKRDIIGQQTLAVRQLCHFFEESVASIERKFANDIEMRNKLNKANNFATDDDAVKNLIISQTLCTSAQAWKNIEPDREEDIKDYFRGAARCVAGAIQAPNASQTTRIKLIIAYLTFATQKVSFESCIMTAIWKNSPQDTPGELRSAATLADPERGADDIIGISVLCQELGAYFPGMKALLGGTLYSRDTSKAEKSSLGLSKFTGIGSIDLYCKAKEDNGECIASLQFSGLRGIKEVWTYYDHLLLKKVGARTLLDEHLTVLGSTDAGASELQVEMLGWLRETYRVHTASWNASLPGDGGYKGIQGFNRTIEDRGYWEPNQTVDTVGVIIPYPILLYLTYASIEKSRAALSNNTGGHYQSIQYTERDGMFQEIPPAIIAVGKQQIPFANATAPNEIAELVDSIVRTGPRGIRMGPLYYGYGNAMRIYRLDTLASWQYNEPGNIQGHQGWSPEATYELTPANEDNWLAPADPNYAAAAIGHKLINDGCMGEIGGISWGDSIGLQLAMSGFTLGEDNLNMQPQQKIVFYIAKCLLEEWRKYIVSNDGTVPNYAKKVSDIWIRTLRDGWINTAKDIKQYASEIPIAQIMDVRENDVTHAILEGFTAAVRSMDPLKKRRPDGINDNWNGKLVQANMRPALEFSIRDMAPFRGNVPKGWFTTSSGWNWYSELWLPDQDTPPSTSDSQTQIDFFLGKKGPLAKLFGGAAWDDQVSLPTSLPLSTTSSSERDKELSSELMPSVIKEISTASTKPKQQSILTKSLPTIISPSNVKDMPKLLTPHKNTENANSLNRNSKSQIAAKVKQVKKDKKPLLSQDFGAFQVPVSASNLDLNELPNVPAAPASDVVADVTKSLQSKLIYIPPPSFQTTQQGGELQKSAVDSWSEGMYKMLARGTPDFDWNKMAQLGARFYSDYMNYPVCCTKFSAQYLQQFPKGERFKNKTVPRKFCLQVSPSNQPCISQEMSSDEAAKQEIWETTKRHALYKKLGFQKLVDPKYPDECLRDTKPPHNCLWETPQGILAEGSEAIALAALTQDGRRQEARDQKAAEESAMQVKEVSQLRQQLQEAESELEKARIIAQEPSDVKIRVIGVNLTPGVTGDPPPGQTLLKDIIVTPGTSIEGWTAAAVQGGLDPLSDVSEAPEARNVAKSGNYDIEIPNEERQMTRLGRLNILPDGKSQLVVELTMEQLQKEFPRFFNDRMIGGNNTERLALLEERTGSALMGALESEIQTEKNLDSDQEQIDEEARIRDITPAEWRSLNNAPDAPPMKPLPPKADEAVVKLMSKIKKAVSSGSTDISLDATITQSLVSVCKDEQCKIK